MKPLSYPQSLPSRTSSNPRDEPKRIPGVSIEVILAKMPANQFPQKYAEALIETRINLAFEDEYLKRTSNEPAFCRVLEQRPQRTMEMMLGQGQFFNKELARIPGLKHKQFKSARELHNALDIITNLNAGITYLDTMEYFEVKSTKAYTMLLDGFFNNRDHHLMAVAVIPLIEGVGFDLNDIEIFWDVSKDNPIGAYGFEGDSDYHLIEMDRVEKLQAFLLLVLSIDHQDETTVAGPHSFAFVPVRQPTGNFVHGTLQIPLFKNILDKTGFEALESTNPWQMLGSINQHPSDFEISSASLIVRMFPDQLKELYYIHMDCDVVNTMLMPITIDPTHIFNADTLQTLVLDAEQGDCAELVPEGYSGQTVMPACLKYLLNTYGDTPMNETNQGDSKSQIGSESNGSPMSSPKKTAFKKLEDIQKDDARNEQEEEPSDVGN